MGTPTQVLRAVGIPSGNNDGFSCSLAPFPNLPPLALDDEFVTGVNTPVSGNVLVANGDGPDNDPEGTALTFAGGLVTSPTNGTVTILDQFGNFTYTPDQYFVGTDTFVYEISDASGLTAQATVTIDVTGIVDFKLTKTQTGGPNRVPEPGQVIEYEIELENTGEIPLENLVVIDTLPDGSTGTLAGPVEAGASNGDAAAGQLDLDEVWTYTISYTTTQADLDANADVVNTVTAEIPGSIDLKTATAETRITCDPDFNITKTVDQTTLSSTGTLTYTITVENDGNVTLTNPVLTDDLSTQGPLALTSGPTLSGDTNNDNKLDVTETWVYTATYDVTQADLDLGKKNHKLGRDRI